MTGNYRFRAIIVLLALLLGPGTVRAADQSEWWFVKGGNGYYSFVDAASFIRKDNKVRFARMTIVKTREANPYFDIYGQQRPSFYYRNLSHPKVDCTSRQYVSRVRAEEGEDVSFVAGSALPAATIRFVCTERADWPRLGAVALRPDLNWGVFIWRLELGEPATKAAQFISPRHPRTGQPFNRKDPEIRAILRRCPDARETFVQNHIREPYAYLPSYGCGKTRQDIRIDHRSDWQREVDRHKIVPIPTISLTFTRGSDFN